MNKLLKPYSMIINFLGEALGENVEIALHDLTTPNKEVIAIVNNHNSGREVGAVLSNLSHHYLDEKQYESNDYVVNYKTIGIDGKLMKSATYFIKDEHNEPIGLLCVNVNISDFELISNTMKKILGIKEEKDIEFQIDHPVEILSAPLEDMITIYLSEAKDLFGLPSYSNFDRLNVEEKIHIVKYLQEKGAFKVKGAISLVATKINVSEQTIYRYLKKV